MSTDGTEAKDPSVEDESKIKGEERDFYQAYYLVQIQRQSQHETNRLMVSNFIIAGSLAAIGLAVNSKTVSNFQLITLVSAVVVLNLLAALYAYRSRIWVKVHQARANHALKFLSKDLYKMQKGINPQKLGIEPSGGSRLFNWTRGERVQSYFHFVIILAVVVLAVVWMLIK